MLALVLSLFITPAPAAIVYPLQCSFKKGWFAGELRMSADGKNEFWFANGKGGYYQCRLRVAETKKYGKILSILYGGRLACKTNPPNTWEAAISENVTLTITDTKVMHLLALTGQPPIPCKVLKYDAAAVEKLLPPPKNPAKR